MSWIDDTREVEKLKEAADIVFEKYMCDGCAMEGPKQITDYITTYHFDTPIELTKMLKIYWKRLDKEHMNVFAPVVTVASFKNKDNQQDCYETISPLIYEF